MRAFLAAVAFTLVSLTVAVPAPPTTTPTWSPFPTYRTNTICTEDHLQGDCQELRAFQKCDNVDLEIYGRSNSMVQWGGVVCHYFSDVDCQTYDNHNKNRYLGSRDSRTQNWVWPDLDYWGLNIGSILCDDTINPPPRVLGLMQHSEGDNAGTNTHPSHPVYLKQRSEDTDAWTHVICSQHNFQENCEVIHAMNKCVTLPPKVHMKDKSLIQWGGFVCQYYFRDDCPGDHGFEGMIDSRPGTVMKTELGQWEWSLASVLCEIPVQDQVDPPPHAPRYVERSDTVTGASQDDDAWTTYVCSEYGFKGDCTEIYGLNKCGRFPEKVNLKAKSMMQAQGVNCQYFHEDNCDSRGNWWEVDSHTNFLMKSNLGEHDTWIRSARCSFPKSVDQTERSEVTTGDSQKEDFFTTYVCSEHDFTGTCTRVYGLRQCGYFGEPVDRKAKSLMQWMGLYCYYYHDDNCNSDEYWAVDSPGNFLWQPNLGQYDGWIRSVWCDFPGKTPPKNGLHAKRSDVVDTRSSSCPAPVYMCTGLNLTGDCTSLEALGSDCHKLPDPQHFKSKSLSQDHSFHCWYFHGDECDTKDSGNMFDLDSWKGKMTRWTLGDWNNRIGSVKCSEPAEAGSEDQPHAIGRAEPSDLSTGDTGYDPHKWPVYLCSDYNFEGFCKWFSAYRTCEKLPDQLAYQAKSLQLSQGIWCAFYRTDNCIKYKAGDEWQMSTPSNQVSEYTNLSPYNDWIGSVYCDHHVMGEHPPLFEENGLVRKAVSEPQPTIVNPVPPQTYTNSGLTAFRFPTPAQTAPNPAQVTFRPAACASVIHFHSAS